MMESDAAFSAAEEPAWPGGVGGAGQIRVPFPIRLLQKPILSGGLRQKRHQVFLNQSVVVAAAVAVALFVAVWISIGAWSRWRVLPTSQLRPPQSAASAPIAATPENGFVFILAGNPNGKYVDRDGKIWGGDRYFTGGTAVELKVPYIQGTATHDLPQGSNRGISL